MKRVHRVFLALGIAGAALLAGWASLPDPPPFNPPGYSAEILDREGQLLRLTLSPDEKYRLHTPLEAMAPEFIRLALLQEDQHFKAHLGINPIAVARAAGNLCLGRRGRGGASTIPMQL